MREEIVKVSVLKFISGLLNIDKDEIIASGDNYNDVSILIYVGMGVAMGNAEEDVKKISSYVTDLNTENGVAKVLDNLVLEKVISA
ncbi:MAG: HAD hydrolase family protein [Terrisporobacter sp.]|uniref:HAD hydrolase family protein n=1 Tax=Terrisporobacter sp. TaxID=1965305 RepID=UPI002FCAB039